MTQESAEVIVVGGGAIGASTAYHLTELGVTDVVLLERDILASGSTSKSVGGIRLQFGDELNVRVMLRSLDKLEHFDEVASGVELAPEIDLRQPGYLILIDNDRDLEVFRGALAMQQALGVPSRELSVDEVKRMVPQLETDGLVAATYCDRDGRATPEAVVQAYAAAAHARGVRVRQSCSVTGIRTNAGRIEAVETTKGEILTDTVVCAAGVWSNDIAQHVGCVIPVHGETHWVFFSGEDGGLPETLPVTIDFTSGFYVTRETNGLLFGGRASTIDELAGPATRRLPVMADVTVQSSWWGYYDMSPDNNATIGWAPEVGRFLFATGFSGHGFQQSPAIGEHLAELIVGREPTLDLAGFAADRIGRGEARPEHYYL